jgi:DNA-binding transcriptional LysR family regulator
MIDLRRLSAFVAVVEEGHITRAAERISMQQPALSRIIRGLEVELQVSLLKRLPRGVRPTAAGVALFEEARAVLARAELVPHVVRRVARGEQGRLSIGVTISAAANPFVPALVRKLRRLVPDLAIDLAEAGAVELMDALAHERLDAAFVRASAGDRKLLKAELILDETMAVAFPSGHALDNASNQPIRLGDLAEDEFVLYRRTEGFGIYDNILAACRRIGFLPKVVQEAPRLSTALNMVAAGLGVTIVPASMQSCANSAIAYRRLDECDRLFAPLHCVMRRANSTPSLTRFRSLIKEEIERL